MKHPLLFLALMLGFFATAALPSFAQTLTGVTVCIDPGHPSETSNGTVSRDGTLTENHVNWVVALKLAQLLQQEGATVVMTKTTETQKVTNRHRAEIANACHARLLLRLHCDAAGDAGFATYYPDRMGHTQGVTGPTRKMQAQSQALGCVFHAATILALHGAFRDRGLRGESQTAIGGKQGALTGSIFSHVPALTVEMCVLTNAHDAQKIRTPAGQDLMAQALQAGVEAALTPPQK